VTATDHPTGAIADQGDRFVFAEDGSVAELTYMLQGERLILLHTDVPLSLGGRGIGGTLVRAAVERAAKDGLTIVAWCAFARQWLEDHPDVAGTVTIDWSL
jgi:predicted GNAT family acetyltransferase